MASPGKSNKFAEVSLTAAIEQLIEAKPTPKKAPRTMLLNEANFERFQKICKSKGIKPAHAVDHWIALYLSEDQNA